MPNTRFPTFDPNSQEFNRIYDMGEGNISSYGNPSTSTAPITNRVQQQALDATGFSIDKNAIGGIGGSFNFPVSTPNDFSLSNWGQGSPQLDDTKIQNIFRGNTANNNAPNNSWMDVDLSSNLQSNSYKGPSNKDIATDAYVSSQKAISEALVSNLGQSTAMGWAGFAVQAVQSVANIAMSIEQYKLGKKQFKQAKKEYAYNVDKREQSIHDTLSTRAEQGGLTGQAKEDWMSSRGANANRY